MSTKNSGQNNNVAEIRFGVLGGSSISKGSGLEIKNQIQEIADRISKQGIKIQFNVDSKHLREQLQKVANEVNVKIKNIGVDAGSSKTTTNKTSTNNSEIAASKELTKTLKEQAKAAAALERSHQKAINSIPKITARTQGLGARFKDLIKRVPEAKRAFDKLEKLSLKGLSKNPEEAVKQYDALNKLIPETEATLSKLDRQNNTFGAKLRKTFDAKFIQGFAYVLLGAMTRAFSQIYKNVIELDKAVTDLQIATGKSRKETEALVTEYSKLARQLGATTLEVAQSADTWLRQGYSIQQANKLIADSMMLSKLGQIDSAEAAKALTSAMKGYKVAVEDATNVVDKFTAVDMVAAVSAGDIAKAMAETAASADIAGVSMDRLIGYISTVAEVTQDGAESVGK